MNVIAHTVQLVRREMARGRCEEKRPFRFWFSAVCVYVWQDGYVWEGVCVLISQAQSVTQQECLEQAAQLLIQLTKAEMSDLRIFGQCNARQNAGFIPCPWSFIDCKGCCPLCVFSVADVGTDVF